MAKPTSVIVYQVWSRCKYHRIGHGAWSMDAMLEAADEAKAVAGRIADDHGIAEVKVIAVQEVLVARVTNNVSEMSAAALEAGASEEVVVNVAE